MFRLSKSGRDAAWKAVLVLIAIAAVAFLVDAAPIGASALLLAAIPGFVLGNDRVRRHGGAPVNLRPKEKGRKVGSERW